MKTLALQGYRFPAEWEPHAATWISWPHREGISFPGAYERVLPTFRQMVEGIAQSERVCINIRDEREQAEVATYLAGIQNRERVEFFSIPTNEPWCRDHGPIFLTRSEPPSLVVVDWGYNAWGGKYPPLRSR